MPDVGCREQASERAVRLDLSVAVMQQDDSALAVVCFVQRARATSLVTPRAIGLFNVTLSWVCVNSAGVAGSK